MPYRVAFYPKKPWGKAAIKRLVKYMNLKVVSASQDHDVAFFWKDSTYRKFKWPKDSIKDVVNKDCIDISKRYLDEVHKSVFGYSAAVDPMAYKLPYVQKMNLNALHFAKIKSKPSKPRSWFVYQKLINNEQDGLVLDFRVPIFKSSIPFIYKSYRPANIRFKPKNSRCNLASTSEVFNQDELSKIIAFCKKLGFDYGELDVLRDHEDGRIYIIDANPTPWGPFRFLTNKEKALALDKMAKAFTDNFIKI